MAGSNRTPPGDHPERIVDIDVEQEMQSAFLEYAYSVIYSRALPDARDGLKPVQRRILYTMADMGLRPDRAHVKCGRIVGDVMGKLHPHGDGAIYDALVRLAQDFTMRLPLVDGHGNFGSLDDGPAAYRYCVAGETRIRLADGRSPRFADLAAVHGMPPNSQVDVDLEVLDRDGRPVRADRIFHSGSHPVIRLHTDSGQELTGSHNHPVLALVVADGAAQLRWRRLDELAVGDTVCLAGNAPLSARPSPTERRLGVLTGAVAGRGWSREEGLAVGTRDPAFFAEVVDAYAELVGGRFTTRQEVGRDGLTRHLLDTRDPGVLAGSVLATLLDRPAAEVRVPEEVWSGGPGVKRAFLMAAFEGDAAILHRHRSVTLEYRTTSSGVAGEIAELLLEFGVPSQRARDVTSGEYRLIVAGRDGVGQFATAVSFLGAKQSVLTELLAGAGPAHRLTALPAPRERGVPGAGRSSGQGDRRLGATAPVGLLTAVRPADGGCHYASIATLTRLPPQPVFSVRVDSPDHSFLAGGFVNHNTEARMAPAAQLMTDGLDENVVPEVPNYDGQLTQPEVLPAALPNLLVNGASGIAVGMATNMPPHNLVEVVGAARHLLTHPDASLEDLMRFVPGPDLPTGGKIVGLEGIRDAYTAGRGTFRTRATARVESVTARRQGIVITELPYLVGPEKVIEKIKDLVQAKKLSGIANVVDLTDREKGLRLVIELKGGFNADAVLEQLYRMTPLEDSFGINNVALVEGQPRTLGLREMLEVYVAHRLDVVRRRSEHRLGKARDRLHLVEGLLVAILDIDEVIAVIRSSDDTAQARERLMTVFDLTRVQTDYILEMPLRRLTKYSKIELDAEKAQLEATIEALLAILADESRQREVVSVELADVAATFGTPRRTVLLESAGTAVTTARTAPLEVADDPCWVLLSSTGLLARTTTDEVLPAPDAARRATHDAVVSAVRCTARGEVAAVTSHGRMLRLGVVDTPALPPVAGAPSLSGGARIEEFLALAKGERVLALATLDAGGGSPGIALGTAQGVVKRVSPDYPSNKDAWEIIALRDGDEVVGAVELASEGYDLVFVTSDAQLLRFPADRVRPQGRAAGGIAGISPARGARVVHFGAVDLTLPDGEWAHVVVTVAGTSYALPGTQAGTVKVTPFAEYPAKGRATGGVRCHRFLKGEDVLLLAWAGPGPALAAAANGVAVSLPTADSRRDGSGTPLPQPISAVAGPL